MAFFEIFFSRIFLFIREYNVQYNVMYNAYAFHEDFLENIFSFRELVVNDAYKPDLQSKVFCKGYQCLLLLEHRLQ